MVLQKCINFILYNQYFIFVEILLVYIFVVKNIFFCDSNIINEYTNVYIIVDLFCDKG